MSTSTDKTKQELFKPQPDSGAEINITWAILLLGALIHPGAGPIIVIVAMVVSGQQAVRDFRTARWLHRRDPDRHRSAACAWICVSRGVLKTVVFTSGVLTSFYNPFGWHAPIGWPVPAVLLAGILLHSACAFIGYLVARRHEIRLWIDDGLHISRRQQIWPPRFTGRSNDVGALWLPVGVTVFILVFLGLEFVAHLADGMEIPAILLIVPILISGDFFARSVRAQTPEECWYRNDSASMEAER